MRENVNVSCECEFVCVCVCVNVWVGFVPAKTWSFLVGTGTKRPVKIQNGCGVCPFIYMHIYIDRYRDDASQSDPKSFHLLLWGI